mmetsp:Transcript_4459/g.11406  ORF Transcript_4459/g.11406 Transcript_4459/m.11406 type:complete len:81 (-) Transcript_4459:940-1182(-)
MRSSSATFPACGVNAGNRGRESLPVRAPCNSLRRRPRRHQRRAGVGAALPALAAMVGGGDLARPSKGGCGSLRSRESSSD